MGRSLRTTLRWITIVAGTLSLVTLGALGFITSMQHLAVQYLSAAVESMRVTDAVEVQLLVHHESRVPVIRGTTTAGLERALDDADRFVQSAEERRRVDELRSAVGAYLLSDGDAEVARATAAARHLALLNVDQARRAQRRAAYWDDWSKLIGIATAVLILAVVTALLVRLRRPFRHVADLSEAMKRFSEGDIDSRAPELGSEEVVNMARRFNAMAGALVRARHRQTEYVATAVHDLRTPLTAIQLAVGYIVPGRPLPPEPRVRGLFTLISRQLTRLNGLIGDVLNATWIEAGELHLLLEEFDFAAVVSDSVALFRGLAPEHVIELSVPPDPVVLDADRARINQVLDNLISNAMKYSPAGSRVRVQLDHTDGEISLAVSDEGLGIAPEDRARIFEPFQRRSATHEEAAGTSLGLWVSERVVQAHGGRIDLSSRLGEGSTFRVVLPAEHRTSDAAADREAPWSAHHT